MLRARTLRARREAPRGALALSPSGATRPPSERAPFGLALILGLAPLLGCAPAPAPAPTTPTPVTPAGGGSSEAAPSASTEPPPPVVEEGAPAQIRWGTPSATPGCFFFSGPPGADVRQTLPTTGRWIAREDRVILDFGEGIVFTGSARAGAIELHRESAYDYQGKWATTEHLALQPAVGGSWQGTYSYEECEVDAGPPCPGRCRIQAPVHVRF